MPLALLAGLSACSSDVTRLSEMTPAATDFPGALAAEYRDLATSEQEQGRSRAAGHFARKGLDAAEGKVPGPDAIDTSLPPEPRTALTLARAQLMQLLMPAAMEASPRELARAQMLIDCWQQQALDKLPQEKALCAGAFEPALTDAIEAAGAPLTDHEYRRTLEFAPEVTRLTDEQVAGLKAVVASASALPDEQYWVRVRAYMGKKTSQRKLTEARLQAVKKALMQAGVPEKRIYVKREGSAKAVVLSRDTIAIDTKVVNVTIEAHPDHPAKEGA